MSRNRHGLRRGFAAGTATALFALSMAVGGGSVEAATPGNGNGNGNSGNHGHKNDQGSRGNGNSNKGDKQGGKGHGNNGSGNSSGHGSSSGGNGNSQGHSNNGNSNGHSNSNAGGNSSHGNGGGGGNSDHSNGHSNSGGGKGDPAGNNGTVKITPHGDIDGIPQNAPHQTCVFDIEWYGFDEGSDIISTVTFDPWAPTADVVLSGTEPSQVFVGGDPATGAGTDSGFDGEQVYTLGFSGGEPHPKQGYHVKLTIHTPGSKGSDTKHKVFWVQPCDDGNPPPPPEECPDGSTPIDTDGDGEADACETDEELCPDGSTPTDLDGDGEADDCEIVGPPPSSNPQGDLTAACTGWVTVTMDNSQSTIEQEYVLNTPTQATVYPVEAGEKLVKKVRGLSGEIYELFVGDAELGSVTVPAKCSDNPENPESPENPNNPHNPVNPDVPNEVGAGLVPAFIVAVGQAVGVPWWAVPMTLGGLMLAGLAFMRRRQSS